MDADGEAAPGEEPAWDWAAYAPQYDPFTPPSLLTTLPCPRPASPKAQSGTFFRSASWSPDGSSLLTQGEDHVVRVYGFAPDADYSRGHLPLAPPRTFAQPAPVLALLWHPYATSYPSTSPSTADNADPNPSTSPSTFSFLASIRSQPIHLLSAHSGRPLASYPIVDHVERFVAPHSLAFEPSSFGSISAGGGGGGSERFWAGHDGAVEIFTLARPGAGQRVRVSGTRKARSAPGHAGQRQKGIISALAFSPCDPSVLLLGSYARSLGLYDSGHPQGAQALVRGLPGGVTQVSVDPGGRVVYAAFRGGAGGSGTGTGGREIWAWDLRMFGEGRHWVLSVPGDAADDAVGVGTGTGAGHARAGPGGSRSSSQQRLLHSLDPWGRYLAAGTSAGNISLFDLHAPAPAAVAVPSGLDQATAPQPQAVRMRPVCSWKAHEDAVGCVGFHPGAGALVSVGGSRHWEDDAGEEEDNADGDEEGRTASVLPAMDDVQSGAGTGSIPAVGTASGDADASGSLSNPGSKSGSDSSESERSDGQDSSDEDDDDTSSSSTDSSGSSGGSIELVDPPAAKASARGRGRSGPVAREATLKIWKFAEVGTGMGQVGRGV